jgi:hypothetical protein
LQRQRPQIGSSRKPWSTTRSLTGIGAPVAHVDGTVAEPVS